MQESKITRVLASDTAPRTFAELCEEVHPRTITRGLHSGELTRLVPDQYCLSLHADSWIMRSRAAVEWAGPHAALTGLAALAVCGYSPEPIDLIQVAVPKWRHRSGPPWIRVRSLTMPFPLTIWAPRTAITKPDLALVLGYGQVPQRRRASFVHGAVRAGLVSPTTMDDLARTLTRIPAKRDLLERLRLIKAGAESYLEERGMTTVFTGSEFEAMVYQHRVRVRGESFRVDAFHMPTLTAFELDGDGTHDGTEYRTRDLRRDALLSTAGIATVRFSRRSVFENPQWCREVALETIEARARSQWAA